MINEQETSEISKKRKNNQDSKFDFYYDPLLYDSLSDQEYGKPKKKAKKSKNKSQDRISSSNFKDACLLEAVKTHSEHFTAIKNAVTDYKKAFPNPKVLKEVLRSKHVNMLDALDTNNKYVYSPLRISPTNIDSNQDKNEWGKMIKMFLLHCPTTSRSNSIDHPMNGVFGLGLSGYAPNNYKILIADGPSTFPPSSCVKRKAVINKLPQLDNMDVGTVLVVGSTIGSLIKKLNKIEQLENDPSLQNKKNMELISNDNDETLSRGIKENEASQVLMQLFTSSSNSENDEVEQDDIDEFSIYAADSTFTNAPIRMNSISQDANTSSTMASSDSETEKLESELKDWVNRNQALENEMKQCRNEITLELNNRKCKLQERNAELRNQLKKLKESHTNLFKEPNIKNPESIKNDTNVEHEFEAEEKEYSETLKAHEQLIEELAQRKSEYKSSLRSNGIFCRDQNTLLQQKIKEMKEKKLGVRAIVDGTVMSGKKS
ncbi:MAG: hypothetical protein A3F11_11435 [Gammaproteobacteria bacterium RIFCSPHIGHO2_12_FULL_37_14]|nr:MAG: hypothetical protein A3F11_11435 [Gammaproteobacteria bacterium RIFCSPHIGHO2_12_FULL_37_14]